MYHKYEHSGSHELNICYLLMAIYLWCLLESQSLDPFSIKWQFGEAKDDALPNRRG